MIDERVTIMVVNGQSASAPDEHTRRVVEKTFNKAGALDVEVIAWCEVGDVDVRLLGNLTDKKWNSRQYGQRALDQPQAGLAVSWWHPDVTLSHFSRVVGTAATSEGSWKTGSGIRERSILNCTLETPGWEAPFHVIHPPPLRAPKARSRYIAKALRKSGLIAGDTNFIHKTLVKLDPRRHVVSVGLLALFVPRRFWVSKPIPVDVGSDHLAFIVTIEPKKARKQRLARKKAST